MRIALLTYRGNMYCGGQGIYAACLAREWQRAGHDVHVIAGPPLPELAPDIPLHTIPNVNVFGVHHPDWARRANPFELLSPINLWELGVSRIGVFPEMQSFGLRLLLRWRELQRRHRFDVVFDNQSLSWGLLGIQAAGTPVVSVIHHPLHIDREADYAIDPSLLMKLRAHPLLPALHAGARGAPTGQDHHRERGLAARDRALLRDPGEGRSRRGLQRHRHRALPADARTRGQGRRSCSSSAAPRTARRGSGTLLEALTHLLPEHVRLKIVDGRIPDGGLVMRFLRRFGTSRDRVVLHREMLETSRTSSRQYATARIAVVPSFFEGFGFPASEAMACGLAGGRQPREPSPRWWAATGQAGRLVASAQRPARSRPRSRSGFWPSPVAPRAMGRAARARSGERTFQWEETPPRTCRPVFEETSSVLLTVDLERLEGPGGERLLDAGCGEGATASAPSSAAPSVVGLDLDLGLAARRRGARHCASEAARSRGQLGAHASRRHLRLPFRDETFDKVICSEVMEHVHDYRAAARELARVTRPGGMVAVTIPTATSEHLYLRTGDDYFESPGGHIRIFRPASSSPEGLAERGTLHGRGGLRPRAPHPLLGAALAGGPARGRRAAGSSRPTEPS